MTTSATPTLKQLSRKARLTFAWGAKLDWDKQDGWQQNADGYSCCLHYQGRRYTFDFWQGIGISQDPTAEGCLECLLSDAQSGSEDFEEFCANCGYDSDSRKAERIWKGCKKVREKMKRLLGNDFEAFLYAET